MLLQDCCCRTLTPRIARKGIESSERLGRHRWVVERTNAWLLAYRRLTVRSDRHAAAVLAFLHLACALVCLRFLRRAEEPYDRLLGRPGAGARDMLQAAHGTSRRPHRVVNQELHDGHRRAVGHT